MICISFFQAHSAGSYQQSRARIVPGWLLRIGLALWCGAGPATGGPLDNWVLRHPLPTQASLANLNFLNGQFYAFGVNGSVLSSSDGTNLVVSSSGVGGHLAEATYGNGRVVAVGGSYQVTSAYGFVGILMDGQNWIGMTNRALPPLTSIAFGQGIFVTVGRFGANVGLWTSTDGREWTKRTLPGTGHLASVAYADGTFLAVGGDILLTGISNFEYHREAYASRDGMNWTRLIDSAERPFNSVVSGAGQFLALSYNSSPVLFKRGDDDVWAIETANQFPYGPVAFGDRVFKMLVTGPGATTSSDGLSWSPALPLVGLGADEAGPNFYSLAFGNGIWVGVGLAGLIGTSADAVHWFFPGRATTLSLTDICEGNGLLVAVGGENYNPGVKPAGSAVVTSPDGRVWSKQRVPSNQRLVSIVHGAEAFVAVGGDPLTDSSGTILVSSNGIDWASAVLDQSVPLIQVVYGNGMFAAIGQTRLISSADGAIWTTRLMADGQTLTDLAFGRGRFVLSSIAINNSHTVYSSTNLVNWDGPFPLNGDVGGGLVFGNGLFRVPGRGPGFEVSGVYVSPDALQWTLVPTSEPQPDRVVSIPGRFVGLRNRTSIMTSANGVNWDSREVGSFAPLNGLVYAKRSVFAVGDQAAILQSGLVNPSFLPPGVVLTAADGLSLTIGSEIGDVVTIESSPDLVSWSVLGTTTNLNGTVRLLDRSSPRPQQGFYRARAAHP